MEERRLPLRANSPEVGWPKLSPEVVARADARERSIEALEEALCAIWVRARICLGGATLKAVFDRVLKDAVSLWPHLSFIEVTCSGVRFHRERPELVAAPAAAIADSFHQVVRELVLVLGSLSGQVLSSPLRAVVDSLGTGSVRS